MFVLTIINWHGSCDIGTIYDNLASSIIFVVRWNVAGPCLICVSDGVCALLLVVVCNDLCVFLYFFLFHYHCGVAVLVSINRLVGHLRFLFTHHRFVI